MAYKGSVEIASGLIGINGRDIPLVHEKSIQIGDSSDDRLDALIDAIQEDINNRLEITGGTITGSLLIEHTPTKDSEVANKQYVDKVMKNVASRPASLDEDDLNAMLQEVLGL